MLPLIDKGRLRGEGKMTMLPDELHNLVTVARRLKVSREQARRLCTSGRLAFITVGIGKDRNAYRVLSSTLDAFMRDERRMGVKQELRSVRETLGAMSGVEERW